MGIRTATPEQLVVMLYEGAIAQISESLVSITCRHSGVDLSGFESTFFVEASDLPGMVEGARHGNGLVLEAGLPEVGEPLNGRINDRDVALTSECDAA